jgi:cell division protein FtsW
MPEHAARKPENAVLYIIGALVGIGIVAVYSSSAFKCLSFTDSAYCLKRQLAWALISIAGMVVVMNVDYRKILKYAPYILGGTALLLLAVLVPGVSREVNGARRWIQLGPVNFQPSEAAKLAVLVFAAWYAAKYGGRLKSFWKGFLPAAAVIGAVSGLILIEPDLGSSVFIGTVAIVVLLIAGVRLWHLAVALLVSAPAVAYVAITRFEHVANRLSTFFNPDLDPLGLGHQVHQSLVALGSGGLFGAGLGESRQKLFYLPAERTDFIFAIIGEELGFIGTCLVIALFAALLINGMRIVRRTRDNSGFLLAFGIVFSIALQAILNIAVVTGSIPPKGIPLPFISFGGSGLFFLMISIGMLINISRVNASIALAEEAKETSSAAENETNKSGEAGCALTE